MADDRETIMFKKVPDGYVFRAPNPWVFGRARYYLVDEALKAQLAAIVTARSPLVFWIAFVVLIVACTAVSALTSSHDNPTAGDIGTLLTLIPVALYGAALIAIRPTARRLRPLLADLPTTDQRITSTDLRVAIRKTMSFPAYLVLGTSQAILSSVFFIQAMQKTNGNLLSVFDNGSALTSALAGTCLAIASTSYLFTAINKFMHGKDDGVPTGGSVRRIVMPILCLAISIALFAFVVTFGSRVSERNHRAALIQSRLDVLTERSASAHITSRQARLKARIAANKAHMNELIGKFDHPATKCEPVSATDDSARQEEARICSETLRKEREAIQIEMAATRKETDTIRQETAALQRDIAAIRMEIDSIRTDIAANR